MNYIVFNKNEWTESLIEKFCEEQKMEPLGIVEELLFFVVKITEPEEQQKFRLLEVTPTITFILKDDPSLDEFMELETSLPSC